MRESLRVIQSNLFFLLGGDKKETCTRSIREMKCLMLHSRVKKREKERKRIHGLRSIEVGEKRKRKRRGLRSVCETSGGKKEV